MVNVDALIHAVCDSTREESGRRQTSAAAAAAIASERETTYHCKADFVSFTVVWFIR